MLNTAEHEIILLINIKMPTVVGILIFISKLNFTLFSIKKNVKIIRILIFFSWINHMFKCDEILKKSFISSGPRVASTSLWGRDVFSV